jgi:beta-glucosidase
VKISFRFPSFLTALAGTARASVRATIRAAALAGVVIAGGVLWSSGGAPAAFADDQRSTTRPVYRAGEWRKYGQQFNAHINAATAGLKKGDAQLVFVGDSITEGWASDGRATWNKFYGTRNALNLGLSADRTQNVLFRLEKLKGALGQTKPKAVVVLIGYNNITAVYNGKSSPAATAAGVKAVVQRLKASWPSAKYLVLHVLPAKDPRDVKRIKELNALLPQTLRGERNVTLLDFTPAFATGSGAIKPNLTKDGVHLTAAGYEVWAEKMEPALAKILGPL